MNLSNSPRGELITLSGAIIGHGQRRIAGPLDLRLDSDDFLVLVGPNGSGKSTLVKTLLGVLPLLDGELRSQEAGVRFGYVPQREQLDPIWPFTALELALMGAIPQLSAFRFFRSSQRRRALEILEQLGLGAQAQQPFRSLSGGQQQRALIARALVSDPDVLVLDEPTNHLDVPGERAIYDLLAEIHLRREQAILVISHHLAPVLRHATRLAILREGKLVEGTPAALIAEGALGDLWEEPPSLEQVGGASSRESTAP